MYLVLNNLGSTNICPFLRNFIDRGTSRAHMIVEIKRAPETKMAMTIR
jgi:hypothetical protein